MTNAAVLLEKYPTAGNERNNVEIGRVGSENAESSSARR
jgi:hypothetical protein